MAALYYLAMYLGVGWTIAVLCGRVRENDDMDADAQRWYLALITVLWPAYVVTILIGSLVTMLWWVRRR